MIPLALLSTDQDAQNAVDNGKNALQSQHLMPWYDPASDSLKPLRLAREKVEDYPSDPFSWKLPSWLEWIGSATLADLVGDLLRILGYLILIILVACAVYFVVRAIMLSKNPNRRKKKKATAGIELTGDVDRIDQLPFQLEVPRGNLLDEARRRYEQGDYRTAIIYLYSYKLLRLDERQFIQLTLGKTNRQYLREVRQTPALAQILGQTMGVFEDAFFGQYQIVREQFEPCWQSLTMFHDILARREATT